MCWACKQAKERCLINKLLDWIDKEFGIKYLFYTFSSYFCILKEIPTLLNRKYHLCIPNMSMLSIQGNYIRNN